MRATWKKRNRCKGSDDAENVCWSCSAVPAGVVSDVKFASSRETFRRPIKGRMTERIWREVAARQLYAGIVSQADIAALLSAACAGEEVACRHETFVGYGQRNAVFKTTEVNDIMKATHNRRSHTLRYTRFSAGNASTQQSESSVLAFDPMLELHPCEVLLRHVAQSIPQVGCGAPLSAHAGQFLQVHIHSPKTADDLPSSSTVVCGRLAS